jgi:hypothetical protein
MIKLFDIQNKVIVPTEHCYTLESLKNLMDLYPDHYLKIYQYLFYMCCYDPDINPFFNVRELDREEIIMKELGHPFSTEDPGVQEALKFCKTLYTTPTLRAFLGIKIALDNVADFMANTKITGGKDGNATQVKSFAADFDKIRQSYKGTERDLIEEQQSRIRGGGGLAYDG